MFEGEAFHTDSLDNEQPVKAGEVNWMTAGRGITHAEQVTKTQTRMHGLQSWVGLPHDMRQIDPGFDNFPADTLPVLDVDGASITVIAGELEGCVSPIPTFQELSYFDVSIEAGSAIDLVVHPDHELAIYTAEGSIEVGGTLVKLNDLAKLSSGDELSLTAPETARFVVFGGEPLPDPVVIYWNFVTDTVGEAKQAAIDWQDGKFPVVSKYRKFTSTDLGDEAERMQLL